MIDDSSSESAVVQRMQKRIAELERENALLRDSREREDLLRQLRIFDVVLSNTPDFTYTFDLEGRFTYVNRSLLSLWQLPLGAAVGKNFFELDYPAELAARLQRQIQEVIATKEPLRDNTPFTGPDGQKRYYEYIFVPVRSEDGGVVAVTGSTRDITDQTMAAEALRESESRFSRAFAEAPIGMVLAAPDGAILEMNQAFLDMVGYSREELELRDSSHFTHPDDLKATREFFRSHVVGGSAHATIEKRYLQKDGGEVWARATATMLRDAHDGVTQIIAIIEDITERKRVESALRESEARLAAFLEQLPVGAGLTDAEGRWVVSNSLLRESVPEKVPSKDPESRLRWRGWNARGELRAPEEYPGARALRGEMVTGDDFLFTSEDGEETWMRVSATPFRGGSGEMLGAVCVVQNIDARKRMEEELSRSNEDLSRANRELEEFAYVASHDLQEPLRMVNIYAQLLLRRFVGDQDVEAQRYAEFVRAGVHRMEDLIHDLLLYSRAVHPEQERAEPAGLNVALEEAMEVLLAGRQETGAIVTAGPLPAVLADVRQLALVFQNLLSNALKYRRADGTPRIEIAASERDGRCIVTVRDDGIGFDPAHAERIFGLFKRLHKDCYPGTGLGLAICKRIVERYGGRIWAESDGEGRGATFSFSLPSAPMA